MENLETLDRLVALDPLSQDGQAFEASMQSMVKRLGQGVSPDASVPAVRFLLADDPAPYIRVETYDDQPAIIISKGLIGATRDEHTLAAMLTYQLLEKGLLPERAPIAGKQRGASIERTMQAIDYMRDAGYTEQGMMRALELLGTSNDAHPAGTFAGLYREEIGERVRDFGTQMEIAKRTRTEGWKETAVSSSTMRDFEGQGDYRDFQIDVASAKRHSRLEQWLESRGYQDAPLTEQAHLLEEALTTLPALPETSYMALWQDFSRRSHDLDQALLQAGEQEASTRLRTVFQEAATEAGVQKLVYVTDWTMPLPFLQTIREGGGTVQDGFGFLLPLPLMLDEYIHAVNHPLPEPEPAAPSMKANVATHVLQWQPPEDISHPLKDFKEWLDDPEHKTDLRERLKREKEILATVRAAAREDTEVAAQMAHYAITACGIMEPAVFKGLVQHWKEGIPALIGTEAKPVAGGAGFHEQVQAVAEDVARSLGQQRATRLLTILADKTEAQPETAFRLEEELHRKRQSDEMRFGNARVVGEWMATALIDQPDVRTMLLKTLMQPNPGSALLGKLESAVGSYAASVSSAQREEVERQFETTIETMKQMVRLGRAVGAETLASGFDEALAGVERLHDTMRELAGNPDKVAEMSRMGVRAYISATTGDTMDAESLEAMLNLGSNTFWDTAVEVRGMVTTALLFADGRTADSPMPAGLDQSDASVTIRDFIKAKVIPAQLKGDARLQVETFIDNYTHHTNNYDGMAILGYALALSKPVGESEREGLSEGERQGQILTQVLSSFGPLGVKFAQAIEGMPHISNEVRAGMSSSKENPVDMPRWEYFHKVMDRLTPEVKAEISHFGPVLAAGSNQFTGIATYKGEESAVTCLHDAVRERAAFEADMLQGALRAVREKTGEMGRDTASLRLAEGLLGRAYDVMKTEHDYTMGKWQVQTAQDMYNGLEVNVGGMPIRFKVVDWKAHGDDFKIESLAHGTSFKKLQADPQLEKEDLQKLAKGIQVVENMWLVSGQIFDSDRHGANLKAEPVRNKDGEITGWQVNIFDVGALMTERPTRKARVALGKAMGEALSVSERDGIPFSTAMQTTLLEHAQRAKDHGEDKVADYLYEVPKGQLAQQDYNTLFSPEEREANGMQTVRTLLLSGRVDTSIAHGMLLTGGEPLFHKAKDGIGANVRKLLEREKQQPSFGRESPDTITIRGGRSVNMQPLPSQR